MSISKTARVSIASRDKGGKRLARKEPGRFASAFANSFGKAKPRWSAFTEKPAVRKIAAKARTFGVFAMGKARDFGTDLRAGYRAFRASHADRQEARRLDDAIGLLESKGYEVKPMRVTEEQLDAQVERTPMDEVTEPVDEPVEPFVPEGEEARVPTAEEAAEEEAEAAAVDAELRAGGYLDGPDEPEAVPEATPKAPVVELTDAGYSMMGLKSSLDEASRKGIMDSIVAMRDYLDAFLNAAPGERDFRAAAKEMAEGGRYVEKLAARIPAEGPTPAQVRNEYARDVLNGHGALQVKHDPAGREGVDVQPPAVDGLDDQSFEV